MRFKSLLLGVCLALLTGCETAAPAPIPLTLTAPPTHLWLGVTPSAAPLVDFIEANYATEGVVLHFVEGSGRALRTDLADDQLDALLLHTIPPTSADWFNPIALNGLAVIVHPENPVTDLTLAQVRAIFSGRIVNWAEVGGLDQPAAVNVRDAEAEEQIIFEERVLAEARVAITAERRPTQAAMLAAVAQDPQAIGLAMAGYLPDGVRPVSIDGLDPLPTNLGTQQYALTAPLYIVAPQTPNGELRRLVEWLQLAETQALLGAELGRVR